MEGYVELLDCNIGMRRFPDGYFDLGLIDIPYGIDVGNMAYLKEKKHTVKQKNGSKISAFKSRERYDKNYWDKKVPDQSYFDELCRVTRNQIIFGIDYTNWHNVGHGRIKWNKGIPESMSFKSYETAYCSMIDYVKEIDILWHGMRQGKSISEPMVQQGNKKLNEKRIHPTHKPSLLYKKILMEFGFPGMKILDTHLGSGSSRVASYEFGAGEFIGFETEKTYLDKHNKWYARITSQLKIF